MLYTFCGISGSGKSTRIREHPMYGDMIAISPDELRKAITGDTSNQSANHEVFAAAYYMLVKLLYAGMDVIFDATNLDEKSFKKLLALAEKTVRRVHVEVLIDSLDVELCRSRIVSDLTKGVDRARTAENGILEKQHAKFIHMLEYFEWIKDQNPIIEGITRI